MDTGAGSTRNGADEFNINREGYSLEHGAVRKYTLTNRVNGGGEGEGTKRRAGECIVAYGVNQIARPDKLFKTSAAFECTVAYRGNGCGNCKAGEGFGGNGCECVIGNLGVVRALGKGNRLQILSERVDCVGAEIVNLGKSDCLRAVYTVKRAVLKSYALFTVNVEVDGKECVVLSYNHLGHSVAVHRLKVRGEVYVGKVGSLRDSCVGFGACTRGDDNVNERADLKSGLAVSFVILVVLGKGNLAELYAVERLCLNEHYVGGYVKNLARLCSGAVYEDKIVAVYHVNNVVDSLICSASFHYVKACKGVGEHCLYRVVVKLFVVAADGLKLRGKSY